MQVILMEKVANLGDLGAVVRVKDGYARNFLIPKHMAKRATPAAKAELVVETAIEARLSVVFSDPGMMRNKVVQVSSKGGSLTKILRAEEKARNYTTAKIQHGGVTIATLYRPLGSGTFQTAEPEPDDR